MAQDTIDQAIEVAQLEHQPSVTENFPLHGYIKSKPANAHLAQYGSDADEIEALSSEKSLSEKLHPKFEIKAGEVVWCVRNEMARTVEDFLARRTRVLFLDVNAAIEMAPAVAELMAKEMKENRKWQKEQVESFAKVAKKYLVDGEQTH